VWGDAFFRSANALFTLYSADPKLANIGFVWMPLPTLLNLPWVALYPAWPSIVSSGVASSLTSAVCGGGTAAVLLSTATRLGLPNGVGWAYALLVSANPMIFLYAGTGMSEGVVAPFLVAAVCCVTLFWHSGQRWWVGAAGVALALGFAAAYETLPFGAVLFAALICGILWPSEARPSAPLGRARAVEGLGTLFLVPSVFTGALWVGLNAIIMKDPLFFARGDYGYSSFASGPYLGAAPQVVGNAVGVLGLVMERTWMFLVPMAFVLVVRIVDQRLWRINTVSAVLLALSVPFGMVAPMAYIGSPMGYARYLMYPLFAAAGWGLFEIAVSSRRRRATALVLAGWIAAIPSCLWLMSNPVLGVQEHPELKALLHGRNAQQLGPGVWAGAGGAGDPVATRAQLTRDLEREVLARASARRYPRSISDSSSWASTAGSAARSRGRPSTGSATS
jgi:4-amino-4-deoxy-L-arabinose transferase-like glycosyltransferase